jgi:hypothetical protein
MEKVQIAIWATPAEVEMFEYLKKQLLRRSNSDLIRHLVNQEYKKILSQDISKEIISKEGALA